jgi:hypothetical protein
MFAKGSNLGLLLQELNCPFGYLHNAGNDANYGLRALLLLMLRGCQNIEPALNHEERSTLSNIEVIARSHLPVLTEASYPNFSGFQPNATSKQKDAIRHRNKMTATQTLRKQHARLARVHMDPDNEPGNKEGRKKLPLMMPRSSIYQTGYKMSLFWMIWGRMRVPPSSEGCSGVRKCAWKWNLNTEKMSRIYNHIQAESPAQLPTRKILRNAVRESVCKRSFRPSMS